jgi:hypothetical protein
MISAVSSDKIWAVASSADGRCQASNDSCVGHAWPPGAFPGAVLALPARVPAFPVQPALSAGAMLALRGHCRAPRALSGDPLGAVPANGSRNDAQVRRGRQRLRPY